MKHWFKSHAGRIAYWLFGGWAIARYLAAPDHYLHYKLFQEVARHAWSRQMPYNSDFGAGIGVYFYSPSSALFFFGPFAVLPEVLGAALYMFVSMLLLDLGLRAALSAIGKAREQAIWLFSAPLVMLSGGSQKLEVASTGCFLLGIAWLLQKKPRLAWVALAGVANWKLQALPAIALLLLPEVVFERNFKNAGLFSACFIGWALAPLFVVSPEMLWEWTRQWLLSVDSFSRSAFMNYDNGFIFLSGGLGISLTWGLVTALSSILFGGFASAVLVLRARKKISSIQGVWIAVVFGVSWTLFCSPLGQNSAWVWAVAALVGVRALEKNRLYWAMGLTAGFAYTSLWPWGFREHLIAIAFKPLAFLVGAIACGIAAFGNRVKRVY